MPVVKLAPTDQPAVSGSGMDRVVERRGLPARTKWMLGGGGAAAAAVALFVAFAPLQGNSQSVAADRVTVSSVARGTFEDFVPLRGRVEPSLTVFLDAVEGGRVEQRLVEDGAYVQKGQLLAVLSNAELQLNVLARETEVTQQISNMQTQELALTRARLSTSSSLADAEAALAKAKRQLDRDAALAANGWVSAKALADSRNDYERERQRLAIARDSRRTDDQLAASQLRQMRTSSAALQRSLSVARANLDSLNVRAPVAGQLSAWSLQVGQSLQRGERLGQIDSPGRNKLTAPVDEYYLGRVRVGQTATVDTGGRTFDAKVIKIYPTVKNGSFDVDLGFMGAEPKGIQRGQTLQVKLTLGDPAPALLLPAGSFYNDTGGAWVFVVSPDGTTAEKRPVRLGRRNSQVIEVLDGLQPGERVLTSPYTGLTDKDRLKIEAE